MTKGIVCHFTNTQKTSLASARIALWLAEHFDLDIIDRNDPDKVKDYDVVICVSSPSGFADPELREQIGEICGRAKHYIFAQNDYMTSQAGQIGKWMDINGKDRNSRHVWSTLPRTVRNPWDTYINWNMLLWDEGQFIGGSTVEGLSYYGACRKSRVSAFKKYFSGDLPYKATISTSKRGANKFRKFCNPDVVFEDPFDSHDKIARYRTVLYLEDEYSTRHYSSPASRFYECLSKKVPQLFDSVCVKTFDEAGFNIRPYIVESKDEVREVLDQWKEFRKEQVALWSSNYKTQLTIAVNKAWKEVVG